MRVTHTYAVLEVSSETYQAVRALLNDAGYAHAFHANDDGEVIDMHGIGLKVRPEPTPPDGPPTEHIEAAIAAAVKSPCRSKRGVALTFYDSVLATGYNRQTDPFSCDGSERCKATCGLTAIHAEQMVLIAAGRAVTNNCDLLHVKVNDAGTLVASGPPSCVQCSKLAVEAGIRGVWLFHGAAWTRYPVDVFHRMSVRHAEQLAAMKQEAR